MSEDGGRPLDGPLIGGRYRLLARLGSGPTGTVWRARDERDGADVAVKEPQLPGDPADDEDSGRLAHRLYREARAATRVRHPSAAGVLDVVEEGGLPWIVTELVEGESLDEAVRRGPLPPAEAARVGLAVLGALRAAHAVGIVHRDIKPANVLIESATGRVVVTDFGTGDGHAEEAPAGFTAPERAHGPGAGPASDLWSLGALLAAATAGGDPGPLGPLLDRLRAPDPAARPTPAETAKELGECAGVEAAEAGEAGKEQVPDETGTAPSTRVTRAGAAAGVTDAPSVTAPHPVPPAPADPAPAPRPAQGLRALTALGLFPARRSEAGRSSPTTP